MTKAALVATVLILGGASLLGGLAWWRAGIPAPGPSMTVEVLPGFPLDVQAYLQKRSTVSPTPAPKDVEEMVRSAIRTGSLSAQVSKDFALAVATLALEADSDECEGRLADVDGDGRPDLVIKRYYTGSGAVFEIIVCLDGSSGMRSYLFSGSERGITFFGNRRIPLDAHFLDLDPDGCKALIIPDCIVDRGAGSVLNWPTVYSLRDGRFDVSDAEYKGFYEARVLPQFARAGVPADDPDAKVVRELVRGLGRR